MKTIDYEVLWVNREFFHRRKSGASINSLGVPGRMDRSPYVICAAEKTISKTLRLIGASNCA